MLTLHLKLAKMLRYLSYQIACDVTFMWWMLSWFVTRHVLFCKVIASTYLDLPRQVEYGWRPERGYWFTKEIHTVFLILLVTLEVSALIHPIYTVIYSSIIDNSDHLVVPDNWSSISRTKG